MNTPFRILSPRLTARTFAILWFAVCALCSSAIAQPTTETSAHKTFAELFVRHYNGRTFTEIPKHFSPEMLQKMKAEQFVGFISGLREGIGEIQSCSFVEMQNNGAVAVYEIAHARPRSLLQFSLDANGLVTSFRITPAPAGTQSSMQSSARSTVPISTSTSASASNLLLPIIRSEQDFRATLEQVRTAYGLPALAAVVLTSSGIRYIDVVGKRSIVSEQQVTLSDKFHIGSNGKAMTGFLAARLVESDILQWNTKVLDIFPEFRSAAHTAYTKITLQDVLSHRAGISSLTAVHPSDSIPGIDFLTTSSPQQQRYNLVQWLLTQPPTKDSTKDSGTTFSYSNAGYALAAAMMEKATGESWETLMERYVWNPLDMKAIVGWAFTQDSTSPLGHIPQGTALGVQPLQYRLPAALNPAGNISLSLPDYAKFLQANLAGLQGKGALLKPSAYQLLHTISPQYAIGWGYRHDSKYGAVSSHNGSAGTFVCHASILHEHNLAIAIITNAGGQQSRDAVNTLKDHLLQSSLAFASTPKAIESQSTK